MEAEKFDLAKFMYFYNSNRFEALKKLNKKFRDRIFLFSDEEVESEYEKEIIEHYLHPDA